VGPECRCATLDGALVRRADRTRQFGNGGGSGSLCMTRTSSNRIIRPVPVRGGADPKRQWRTQQFSHLS
jgi:hypothetical protein